MPSPWVYEPDTHRYRNSETGRFIGATGMAELRDKFMKAQTERTAEIATRLSRGEITVQEWTTEMRGVIRQTYTDNYVMAHGGRGTMTPSDWGKVGQLTRAQYEYLQKFGTDLKNGKYDADGVASEAAIARRAGMYPGAANEAFAGGMAGSMGLDPSDLPALPGDGSTRCLTNCLCAWSIEYVEEESAYHCFWQLGLAEHCEDCLQRAADWNPLVIEKRGG